MDFPQKCGIPFPGNASAANASPSATTSSYRRPVPIQPRDHAGVLRDSMFPPANATGNDRPDDDWEETSPPAEITAARGQPQDRLQYVDMGYYDMANDCHEDRNKYAGVALDFPAQAQAAPPAPIDIFEDSDLNAAAGPARVFLGEFPHQGPVPNGPANELLRQLAILYLREPNSQVAVISMEPGQAHGITVHITLELR